MTLTGNFEWRWLSPGSVITFFAVQRLTYVLRVRESGTDGVPSIVRMMVMSILTIFTILILDWRVTSLVVPLLPLFVHVRHRYRNRVRGAIGQSRGDSSEQAAASHQC
jgi:ABC-type multidrug transport system fused ATPase/permease subunit